ncbi:hypothetical protein D3C78_1334790 [compost metagenome]
MYQPGLHAVLRRHCAIAAVAAGGLWLYRHLGRAGFGTRRVDTGIAVADHRQVRQPARYETIGDLQFHYVCGVLLLARLYL